MQIPRHRSSRRSTAVYAAGTNTRSTKLAVDELKLCMYMAAAHVEEPSVSALPLSHLHLINDLGGSSVHVILLTKTDPTG